MSGNPLLEASADVRETLAGFVPAAIRRRFALKLGVLFLVVVVVIAGVGGIIYLQTGSSLKQDTKQQLSASSQLQAETVSGWDSRMEEQTKFMVHAEEVKSGETASVQSFVDGQLDSMPDQIVAIHYVNTRSGEVLASSHDDATGTTLVGGDGPVAKSTLEAAGHSSDHEHSGEDEHAGESSDHGDEGDHTEHAVVHTRPYQSQQAGGPVMAYLTTIGDQNRAIVVVTDLAARAGTMQRPLGSETWTHVVNDEGVVVLSHQTGKIGAQNMGSSGVDSMAVEMGLQGNNGYMEMQMGGRAVSMGFAPVPGTDWVVMTHVESSDAFALQQDVLGSIVALVALAFVGLAAIGLTVGRSTAQSLEHLSTRAKELEDGDLGVELETSRSDEIGRLYTSFDSMRDSLRDQIDEAEAARTEAEAARQEAETLNDHLESKAEAYQRVMEDCAEGDLTRRMDPTSQSEAMRAIADTFNGMMDQLEAITHQVKGFADAVASSSEEVTASSEEIQSSADQVANSVQEISDGADRQSETLQSVAEEMNTLSTTIEEMAASANQVAETAEETATTGEHARESAAAAIEEMSDVERESEAAVTAIEDLQSRMAEIEEITEFITDVAEQTNVLALNANIEAARAGEAGEGFAVVAEEVKDLAEETRDAAEEIEELVVGLREQTETTADEVRSTSDEVARSAEAVEETVDALREIAEYAEETNTGVQEISAATQQQASSTNEVVSMVDDAAAIASQTADEASTVAGASEEQTAALSEMTDNAGSLAAEADQLRQSLDRFGTDPDPRQTTDEDDLTVEAEDD